MLFGTFRTLLIPMLAFEALGWHHVSQESFWGPIPCLPLGKTPHHGARRLIAFQPARSCPGSLAGPADEGMLASLWSGWSATKRAQAQIETGHHPDRCLTARTLRAKPVFRIEARLLLELPLV